MTIGSNDCDYTDDDKDDDDDNEFSGFSIHVFTNCSRIYKAYIVTCRAQKCEIMNNLKYKFLLCLDPVMLKLGLFHIGNRNTAGPYAQTPSNKYS